MPKKKEAVKKENKKVKKQRSPQSAESKRGRADLLMDCDARIVITVVALTLFGIIMVFSASSYTTGVTGDPYHYLKSQTIYAVTGLFLMWLFSKIDYHSYVRGKWVFLLVSLGLLIALIPAGVTVNAAKRWIYLGPLRITPSEISKLAMIMFTSIFLAERPEKIREFTRGLFPLFVIMGVHAGLIIWQPNLSTAIVLCAIMVGIMFVAGMNCGYIGALAGVGMAGLFYIMTNMQNTHWYSRLTSFVDPFADAQGEGYQVVQSLIALGNGGLKGVGLGNSVQKNLYLPEPQNDFILAIIGEEWGFIGVSILMLVYLFLIWRCIIVSANAKDKLGMFMASGVSIMLGLQVIINVAVVTSSMPATGITLPFVSAGGTSIWVFMAAIGVLLNVSKRKGIER